MCCGVPNGSMFLSPRLKYWYFAGNSVAIVSIVGTFAIIRFHIVFVAFVTVVVANDGIVICVPVATTRRVSMAMFFVPTNIIVIVDDLVARGALLEPRPVGLGNFFALGFLAFVPSIIVFNILRHETGTDVVLLGKE